MTTPSEPIVSKSQARRLFHTVAAKELARLLVENNRDEVLEALGIDPCPGNDPTCPGWDHGDPCHYLGPDAMEVTR